MPPKIKKKTDGPSAASGRVARNRMRIAWMYYVEGLTQGEIADALGIGRVTVIRNINEAIKQHEVRIWITGHVAECLELEKSLKDTFGFTECIVVPEPSTPAAVNKAIGAAAGMYVTDQLKENACIGVGWGATLLESLQTLAHRHWDNIEVVSLLGGIVQARQFNPSEFAWQFSTLIGADCYLLAAPALVDSAKTRQALIERCGLNAVLERSAKMDMALLSVGNMSAKSTAFRMGFLSEAERHALQAKGAVGDMLYNFFDIEGRLVKHPVNDRVMSMPIERLKSVPRRILISGGLDKVDAIMGGIKLVNANVLITNEATAAALLQANKKQA
jgi:DNA-binding transcriptional regulator LsrR (DeoR family)